MLMNTMQGGGTYALPFLSEAKKVRRSDCGKPQELFANRSGGANSRKKGWHEETELKSEKKEMTSPRLLKKIVNEDAQTLKERVSTEPESKHKALLNAVSLKSTTFFLS